MNIEEKTVVKNLLDFAFLIKAQLHSEETSTLRSIMNLLIMEAEDTLEALEARPAIQAKNQRG